MEKANPPETQRAKGVAGEENACEGISSGGGQQDDLLCPAERPWLVHFGVSAWAGPAHSRALLHGQQSQPEQPALCVHGIRMIWVARDLERPSSPTPLHPAGTYATGPQLPSALWGNSLRSPWWHAGFWAPLAAQWAQGAPDTSAPAPLCARARAAGSGAWPATAD